MKVIEIEDHEWYATNIERIRIDSDGDVDITITGDYGAEINTYLTRDDWLRISKAMGIAEEELK